MKKITVYTTVLFLFFIQFLFAQKESETLINPNQDKRFHIEAGFNFSLPVHIHMYRTHRLAIGVNTRICKKISPKTELGLKFDYDYRFIKKNSPAINSESTALERALHSNFSLFCLKPNLQLNIGSNWYLGIESGIGYVLSDGDRKIGMGFISEYAENQQFGICSGLYIGKHFIIGPQKKKLGLSLDLTQFLARGHAENTLGIKINYGFNK